MIKVTVSLNGTERTINGNGQHIKGTISQEVGAINSFEFEIFPQNIGFELIQSRKTLVKAINTVTKRVEFAGRVLLAETKMESNGVISKRVTCESYLGYLYDSVQPYADMATMPLRDFLQLVIDNHNNSVESEKRMQLGTVNVEVAGTGNVTKGLQYETTYDTIKSKLVDIFGGELEVVENEGGLTLNYVNQIGTTRATTIELGRNMQAASREVSPLNIITRIIPLGAKIKKEVTDDEGNVTEEETSERLTLVGYAPVAGEPAFSVPWIDDEEKQKECGIVCGKIEFDDVTTQSSLYRKTLEYMQNENLVALSHTLTALDLKEIGQDIDGLNCGESYPVKNVLIGLDEVLRITKKTIDINAPYKGSITIGEKRATLSSIQAGTNATIGELFGAIETIHKATNSLKEHVSSTDKSVNELNTKVEGIEGTFFYIRYSPYADGHVMTDAPEENTEYMGTCSTNENKAPTDYKKYTWVRVKGEQGEQGVAGESGKDGKATYFHVKFSEIENPTTSEQMTETPSKYIGTYVDYTEADSTDPAKYKWIKFTGEDGLAGENGEDGKTYYLHIKYSNDGGATFTAINGETTGEYIGVYTDTTEADSTDTNKYKWSKIKGDKGEAGETGADGKTSYLHIKYSDDGATFTENNGETLGAWIGTLVDFDEYDSTVFSDYTWKKFTEDVDEELEDIRSSVTTLSTDITNNSETISLMASKEYVETSTYEGFKQTIEENIASLQVENDEIDLKFENKTTEINDNVETKFREFYKYFKFTENGLEIRASNSAITLEIDNDMIVFKKNGVKFGWWDGVDFHTGNIVVEVNERAQFGNFAFIPRSSGSLSFLKVSNISATQIKEITIGTGDGSLRVDCNGANLIDATRNDFKHTFNYGDVVTLTFTPDSGASFYEWCDDVTLETISDANPYTFTVGDDTHTKIGIALLY